MKGYVWKALDAAGNVYRGHWELPSVAAVRSRLLREGRYPVSIYPRRSPGLFRAYHDAGLLWSIFMRKLSVLLASGIPLLTALEILARESAPSFRRVGIALSEQVGAGTDLSEAVALAYPSPPAFSQAMIEAGERSGQLTEALTRLVEVLDKEHAFLRRIRSALAYPLFLFWAVVGVLYGLGLWVLPRYEELFQNLGAELPWLSRILFAAARQIPVATLAAVGAGAAVFLGFKARYRANWRLALREKVAHIPGVGSILRLRELVYFSRIMSILLGAGVSLDEALKVGVSAAESQGMREVVLQLLTGIRQGNRLAPLLKASRVFPPMAQEMLSIGEESGRWDEMFGHVAITLQAELEERLQNSARLAEPVMILVLAVFVGVIAAGVLLPVFEISGQMQ
ncbi:MAG: type II secretion system F family protein [Desulfitobacteriaceae bacterium]|nr:type II secretion system F family protein [Desulfitobacteriaceae bacterium]MDI6878482.1 type II secretion system F family protein [Desulfitobacteriaceae bacterium]MDI6912999.1 type II secretion system F family protein [Desulfitobacteriaceae bacterium]